MAKHGGDIYRYNRPIVDFSANINPLGVPKSFKQALRDRIETFAVYPDPDYQTVRHHVAAYLEVNPEWVMVGNGAVELIYQAIQATASKRVYGLAPTFSEYRSAAAVQQLDYIELPVFMADYNEIDVAQLLSMVKPDSTVVFCNPNNPTGTLVTRATLIRIARELAQRNCYLIVDEVFIEFTAGFREQTMLAMVAQYPNLLVIRAATKFFGMPGLRLGYTVTANRNWREIIREIEQPWSVNTAAVIAAEVIFDDQEYLQKSRDWIATERKFLHEGLVELPGLQIYPSQANFFLLKLLRSDLDAYGLQERLLLQGILIRTPQGFSGLTSQHFRVAVKDRRLNELLINALREILTSRC